MGTDHAIIIAWGFRIPISVWNKFKEELKQLEQSTKRRKVDEEWGDSYSETDFDFELLIEQFEACVYPPLDNPTHGFKSQENVGGEGFVLVYDLEQLFETLMDRKVGGALSWFTKGYNHMQNVDSLAFSVKLDWDAEDWQLEDGTWHEDTQRRKDFISRLPAKLREFVAALPIAVHYNRWLFGYAW